MDIEAIITAIIVSLDAFIFGIIYGINNIKLNIKSLIIIGIIPIFMSYVTFFLGSIITNYININLSKYLCFGIFIYLSINALFESYDNDKNNLINNILMGFNFGIDSCVSALSLSITGHNFILIPIYFGVFHGLFILISNKFAIKKNILNINYIKYISSCLFLIIALFKLF